MRPLHSENINEISGALAKAQGAIRGAGKDGYNPHFKSHFTSLHSHWDTCRQVLCENGLAVTQIGSIEEDSKNYLVTILSHSSGQWFKSYMLINPVKTDVQSLGAYLTYLRRYALSAVIGTTSADEDDDAEKTMDRNSPPPSVSAVQTIYPSDEEVNALLNILDKCPEDYQKVILEYMVKNNFMTMKNMPYLTFTTMRNKILIKFEDICNPKSTEEENNG